MFAFVYFLLEAAIKDNILYGIPLYTSIESNLLTVKTTEGNTIQLDFMNGKIEKVWVNGIFIPLSIEERHKISINQRTHRIDKKVSWFPA